MGGEVLVPAADVERLLGAVQMPGFSRFVNSYAFGSVPGAMPAIPSEAGEAQLRAEAMKTPSRFLGA